MQPSRLLPVLLVALVLAAGPPPSAGAKPEGLRPAPVEFHGQTLFLVRTRVGSFTPEARAEAIVERLERASSEAFAKLPALQVAEQDHATDILCGDTTLMTLTEEDARAEGVPRDILAQRRLAILEPALRAQTWRAKLKGLALSLLWAGLATLGGYVVFRGVHFGFRKAGGRLEALLEEKNPGLRIQNLVLISPLRMRQGLLKALGLVQGGVLVLVAYLYLSIIFSFFPATVGLASRLLSFLLGPLKIVFQAILGYLPNLFFLFLIAGITRYFLKLVHLIFDGLQSGTLRIAQFHADWAEPTYRLVRFFVLGFALVAAFPYLPGSGSEAFKGVSLFFGLVFSLGSSGAVGNAVAGILLTYMRPFKVGDRIAVGDTVGDVLEKSALVTRVRTIKNVDVTIPNAMLLGSQVQNFSANASAGGLILHTTVTIGYDAPWRTVHRLLLEAAGATEGLLADPGPFVLQTSLDDFYVSYQINAYTNQPSRMAELYSHLHANIQEAFNTAGVEIMSPHYRAERDGNPSTIPAPNRSLGT